MPRGDGLRPSISPGGIRSTGPEARQEGRVRTVALLAVVATVVLIAVGGLVRATGSGLGCTGWPRCTPESWLPPLEYHALIEYSHRFVAFTDVVVVGGLAVLAARRRRMSPRVFLLSAASVGLVVFQAVLGGVVVRGDLAGFLVAAHLGTAMLLLAALVGTAAAAFSSSDRPRRGAVARPHERLDIRFRRFAWFTAGSVFVLILVGAVVRAESAGLAFRDWPLFGGAVVPKLSGLRPALHFAHRVLALEAGVLISVLAVLGWRLRRVAPPVALLSVSAAGLFLGQVLAGAAAVWSGLAPAAIVAHVGLSSLVWAAVVATAASAQFAESWSRAAAPAPLRRLHLAKGSAR